MIEEIFYQRKVNKPTHNLQRSMLRGRGGSDDAEVLFVRRHGKHRLEDGVDGSTLANPSEPSDSRSSNPSWWLRHRVPGSHRDQRKGQNADLLATREAGL